MVKFKLSGAKARETKTGFEAYDGPTPNKRGFYRGVIKKMTHGRNNSGSMGFNIVLELEAAAGDPKDHAQFDGFAMFSRSIITEAAGGGALKEGAQRNLENLLAALGTGDDPDVVTASGEDGEFVEVQKIGGKSPIGRAVNIDMDFETYEGERRPTIGGIYVFREEAAAASKSKRAAALEPDDEDEEEPAEDDEIAEREAELRGMTIANLRKLADGEYDLEVKGLKKDELVELILDHEFSEEDEAEDDEADDDEADDEDEPDDEPDDEADDDEPDDEDDSEEEARREELQGFNRVALKKILAEVDPDITVLKRHSDDDIRGFILAAEFGEDTPF